jgi:hypothetical protein
MAGFTSKQKAVISQYNYDGTRDGNGDPIVHVKGDGLRAVDRDGQFVEPYVRPRPHI